MAVSNWTWFLSASVKLVFNTQLEANANRFKILNCQSVASTTYMGYKQIWRIHAKNLLLISVSDSISAANSSCYAESSSSKKICNTKNPVGLSNQRKSKNHAVRKRIHLRNGLRKDKASFGKTVILAGKAYLKITLLMKTPLHKNRVVARSG